MSLTGLTSYQQLIEPDPAPVDPRDACPRCEVYKDFCDCEKCGECGNFADECECEEGDDEPA